MFTSKLIDQRRKQQGQTLVEFALACVLFLALLFGIIEFARALWTWNTIVQATRAGARFAVVEVPDANDVPTKNFVVYYNAAGTGDPILPGLGTTNVSVAYLKNDGTAAASKAVADVVQVGITGYTFNFIVPFFGGGITLPAFTTTLTVEALGAT
jgi:Flp pilus assembly protein TadG